VRCDSGGVSHAAQSTNRNDAQSHLASPNDDNEIFLMPKV